MSTTQSPTSSLPHEVPSTTAALKFRTEPLHPNDKGNILLRFRELGYATVSVFERESVDAYLEQIKALVQPNPQWFNPLVLPLNDPITAYPALAPRLRDCLRDAFAPWISPPTPALLHPGWLVKPSNADAALVHDWHKDADHDGQLANTGAYHYPTVIHVVMPFQDLTIEHGPTYIIPRSHCDASLSPYKEFKEQPLLCQKEQVVLWDQRTWHRASARQLPGHRIQAIFAFYGVPSLTPFKPSPAQCAMLNEASSPEDQILFGGLAGKRA